MFLLGEASRRQASIIVNGRNTSRQEKSCKYIEPSSNIPLSNKVGMYILPTMYNGKNGECSKNSGKKIMQFICVVFKLHSAILIYLKSQKMMLLKC